MDKYQKVKVLGKGSFGSAILIKRKADGCLFVVKEVAMAKMSKKEREEARHECAVLQQLQHPNIVRYVEQFENHNFLYIVMEYCDGGDLSGKVKQSRGAMKESNILYFFSQICLAMEYLHARHILHRDIKTMNVFLMKNGAVKLGDFGISTVLRTTMGMANTVCGTPYYFSPELCRNRPYNNKSDIWALGVLLYECATGGRHPFDGTSMNQLMQRIVQGNYAPLSSQYSSDFRKMVDWCLQKDSAKRPSIKQTLALPLMRRSLEQLEENLMLATQCRVRLKDIIDFDSALDQEDRKHVSPQNSPRKAISDGVSPGQAAALAMVNNRPSPASPQSVASPQSPASSPKQHVAVVGPKPSVAAQRDRMLGANQGGDIYRLYKAAQQKNIANPIHLGGGARPSPVEISKRLAPAPAVQPVFEEPRQAQSPRSNINLGVGDRRTLAAQAAAAPIPTAEPADPFRADLRRVDAIIARYGRNTDEKAKETIHAYMRRKQEAYLKWQKEELEKRERRNMVRQEELRRVLENQRAVMSPGHPGNPRAFPSVPPAPSAMGGNANDRSPRRSRPQSPAKPDNAPPCSQTPTSSPTRKTEHASPRTPTSAAAAFGRDPRLGGAQAGRAVTRPTTPQRQRSRALQQRSAAAVVGKGSPLPQTPPRRVVYAANSPPQDTPSPRQPQPEPEPGARRAVTPDPKSSPSRKTGAPWGVAGDVAGRGVPQSKSAAVDQGKGIPLSGQLDAGLGGQRMVLRPAQQVPQGRRPADEEPPPASRRRTAEQEKDHLAQQRGKREVKSFDDGAIFSRPTLSPIPQGRHDPNAARDVTAPVAVLNDREPQIKGVCGAAAGERVPTAAANDPRNHRPGRTPQRNLKPLGKKLENGPFSPVKKLLSAETPQRDAPSARAFGGKHSPRISQPGRVPSFAGAGVEKKPSLQPVDLVDIPRNVAASPVTQASSGGPVEEALRILRKRKEQIRQSAPSAVASEVADLPALNIASPEIGIGVGRAHHRHHTDQAALYGGMMREQALSEEEQAAAAAHRKHPTEKLAVPSTLEAMRSLRGEQSRASAAEAGGRDDVNQMGQLALLKQRQRLQQQQRPTSGSSSSLSAPLPPSSGAQGTAPQAVSPRSDRLPGQERSSQVSLRSGGLPSAPQVTALSLGDLHRTPSSSRSPSLQVLASPPVSPKPVSSGQSAMDGYTEMLQHLKDLLQRRRVTRAGGASPPTSSRASLAEPQEGHRLSSPTTLTPTPSQKRPAAPPLNPLPLFRANASGSSGVLLSPPDLKATKPIFPSSLPALDPQHIENDEEESTSEEDVDFEDAVPLSPVRCTETNDNYIRQQQQQLQQRQQPKLVTNNLPDDVYISEADLTSGLLEDKPKAVGGYAGYHRLPSLPDMLKGVRS